MPVYSFTVPRTTAPDFMGLVEALRIVEPTAGPVVLNQEQYQVKTTSTLKAAQIAAMQIAIANAPAVSSGQQARNELRNLSATYRFLVQGFVDQLNVVRERVGLPALTDADFLTSVHQKIDAVSPLPQAPEEVPRGLLRRMMRRK